MTRLAWAPLQRLSLVRVTGARKVPSVPTNEERLAAFKPFQPTQFANARFNGLSRGERYAANESLDNSTPTTDVHHNEWSRK